MKKINGTSILIQWPKAPVFILRVMQTMETVAGRALWFIESHFAEEISLEGVAAVAGVGKSHLTRAFGAATGYPVMRYVRGRRLTEAARRAAAGAPDILALAVDAGYGSHEAFTRAFRVEFGVTPETLRERGSVDGLALVEPLRLEAGMWEELSPPRKVEAGARWVAGVGACDGAEIPALWQRFGPHIGTVPGQVGQEAYGVCHNEGYLAGVVVTDAANAPLDWVRVRLVAGRYAVFRHIGHVSTVRRTWFTIWNRGLTANGIQPSGEPEFERYGPEFNPRTGTGGFEIWVPMTP